MTRFPAAWNFRDAIAKRGCRHVPVAIVDVGFVQHVELDFKGKPGLSLQADPHGTKVAGVVGANFINRVGIVGASPFVDLYAYQPARSQGGQGRGANWGTSLGFYATLARVMHSEPVKVINISIGFNWNLRGKGNPDKNRNLQEIAAFGGAPTGHPLRASGEARDRHRDRRRERFRGQAGSTWQFGQQPCHRDRRGDRFRGQGDRPARTGLGGLRQPVQLGGPKPLLAQPRSSEKRPGSKLGNKNRSN